jgi:probable F420-dependent oxidoreductase
MDWGLALAPLSWNVIAPGAPTDAAGERSWFNNTPRGVDVDSIESSINEIGRVASDSDGLVVVAGFSQGAAMALHLTGRVAIDAVIAFSGFLTDVELAEASPADPAQPDSTTGVLVVSATDDDVIPGFLSSDAAAAMAAAGWTAEHHAVPGGHSVGKSALALARDWLGERFGPRLRVSLGLPTDRVGNPDFISAEGIGALAQHFEALGAHAAFVTDHPAPDDRWLEGGGHQALEPTVALTAAAAATHHLRLHTHIYVLAYRNPFIAAKALASLDVVSNGRLILGVAAGYLRPEFHAVGSEFETRGRDLEDSLRLMKRIWSEGGVEVETDKYSARSVTALPRPILQPNPPIWVGGNTDAAMRRAVTLGDAWCPFPTPGGMERATRTAPMRDLSDLEAGIERLRALSEEHGRETPPTVSFSPYSYSSWGSNPGERSAAVEEEMSELASMGVRDLAVLVPGETISEVEHNAAVFMEMASVATPPA